MYKLKILIVDDDPDIRDLIEATVEGEYLTAQAGNGKEAIEKAKSENPDLVILDYNMPDMTGVDVCKHLRHDPLFIHLPILMLTGKGEIEDKVRGLEAGVDDYMVKPFVPQELIARVRMIIRRSTINLDANPLTRLPGNVSIGKDLEERIRTGEKFAVLYIDLNNFKAVNDYYGFQRGDEVIKETARILINSVQVKGTTKDFVGHIGGDDFVIITTLAGAEEMAKYVIAEFDKSAPQFFDEKDRIKGRIETKGRDGLVQEVGFPTVAIGVITNETREFTHTAEISSIGADLKKLAKKFTTSKYVFDRRATN
jgi:diguanylate cyclase (GGDEF)-like protein